jgi:pimeloyl-ACP methyl ester carboxylesterase
MTTAKKTIILIHGFRGTHHGLELIAGNLPEFKTIIPDLPGFGEGDTLNHYNLDSYVSWLHDFISSQKLAEPPILLGHSFGSIISSAYVANYPNTIDTLILVNPIGAPALQGPKAILTQLAVLYYFIGRKLPPKLAHSWLSSKMVVNIMSNTMTNSKDKTLRQFIRDQHLTYFSRFHSPISVSEGFVTSITHNVREFAPAITTPTLIIASDNDDITPLEKQRELVTLFPHAHLEVIKNVGHLTHYETPEQVAKLIESFCQPNQSK